MANAIKPLTFAADVLVQPMAGAIAPAAPTAPAGPVEPQAKKIVPTQPPVELRSGPLVELSDAQLSARAVTGDTAAYAELVDRYQILVRNVARSMVQDYQDAEDLAQETFIKAFNSLQGLKDNEKFGPWLFTILRHTVLDFLRSNRGNVSLETLLEEGFEPQGEEAEAEGSTALESHEEDLRTLDALNSLREDYREVIVLKHVEGLSYKEIATRLNMSVSAVGEKLSRVRALLKRRIEKKPIPGKRTNRQEAR